MFRMWKCYTMYCRATKANLKFSLEMKKAASTKVSSVTLISFYRRFLLTLI